MGVSNTLSYAISDIKAELTDAFEQYKLLIKPHKGSDLRDEWFENLAAAKAAANQTTLASQLLQQRQRENQRQAFRAIKWSVRSTQTNFTISQVYETENGRAHLRSTKSEVERAIVRANDQKFRQTNDTPTMSTLIEDFGFLGNTNACHDILQGTYVPCVPIDRYSRAFIAELKKPPHIPSISTSYTADDYANGWRKMNEKITSGLSGIHFGHHKACSQHPTLSAFEAAMCAIPYQSGYSPTRYKMSVNAMLKKKQNKIEADQLRTILLLEADFNHLNKKLGRDLMHQAEKYQMIAPEQFGSRKHHSCIDQVIVKRLYYDSLRSLRHNGFLCSNDAKSCYDRIVHSIASLAMQRVGMPLAPITCMLQTLQDMKHYVKTAHGISNLHYGHLRCDNKPVQGSGQGNGASPTLWTLISSPLLSMMRSLGFGVSLHSPISNELIHFVGCSFVDDTDLLQTSPSQEVPLHQTQPTMQAAIDAWSTGLRFTGGALDPNKNWIYPIEFFFDRKGNPHYRSTNQLNLHFTVEDSKTNRCHLTQINPTEAKETLGVYLSPDGNETAQINHLKNKVARWVENVRTNHISRHHAMLALTTTILKTLEYPAPALTITQKQWTSIMAPLHKCGLQSNGICATIPKVLREGSKNHMALHIKCMFKTQEIQKLEKYLFFRNHPGIVGKMIRLNEELLLLEVGLPGNIYDADYSTFHKLATTSWLKSIWKFLRTYKIHVTMIASALKMTKNNDIFLMEAFSNCGYKNSKLVTLNICRKYLQVVTLGDITGADGTTILPNIKAGRQHTTSTSSYKWPQQSSPDLKSWKLWRQALRRAFEHHSRIAQPHIRSTWAQSPARSFHWYYSHNNLSLLHRLHNNQWQIYRPHLRRGPRPSQQPFYCTPTILNSLPADATPSPILHLAPH